MSTYVLMTKLGPEVMKDPRGRKVVGQEWKQRVASLCPEVSWLAHYALLGPYDFIDIYEAPSEEIAVKVSLISRASGALIAESWAALPYDSFLTLADAVEKEIHKSQ